MTKKGWLICVRYLADIFYLYGYFLWIPIAAALLAGEYSYLLVFAPGSVLILTICWHIRKRLQPTPLRSLHATLALALALGWPLLAVVSSVPFIIHGMTWMNALFEVISAWTDTGLTMLTHPEDLPYTLAIFRVFIQWISSLGFILFLLYFKSLAPTPDQSPRVGRVANATVYFWHVGKVATLIYTAYTFIGFLFLWIAGLPPYEALMHALTSISTGGFSSNSIGVGLYGLMPSIVAILLMVSGSISMQSHRALLSGKLRVFFSNYEVRSLFVIILVASGLLYAVLKNSGLNMDNPIVTSVFFVVTAVTACSAGTITQLTQLPDSFVIIVLILMIIGAVYGYTSGALKRRRLIRLTKAIHRELKKFYQPANPDLYLNREGEPIISTHLTLTAGYLVLYFAIAFAGSLAFVAAGYSTLQALFTVFSAQGNVGLNVIPDLLYYNMPAYLKVQLMIHMFVGRMEIYPTLILIYGLRARKERKFLIHAQNVGL